MKTLSISKKYVTIINKIEKIRSKNNKTWMNILRLAFNKSPKETAKIMSEIYKHDAEISDLVKKLTK
tara:strand:+ start:1211 stop:1411 length:201 start_codon:yes stop_codon:yes gene_type:complete